jgi:hypothetical protein
MINTSPLQQLHKTFADYAEFLFSRWVVKSHKTYNATQVHVIFDHPNRHGISAKDIERARRDRNCGDEHFEAITGESNLPGNWRSFLSNRENKRKLVNFLSHHFLHLALKKFPNNECHFITAGGFDDDHVDQVLGSYVAVEGGIITYPEMRANHEEGDSRVWLHASKSGASKVIIYSPDTDTLFIGLPQIKNLEGKTVYLHIMDTPYEKSFVNMSRLITDISNDMSLHGLKDIENCIQMLYICSGCDFVSFFHGCGKKTFFDCFRQNALFISQDLCNTNVQGLFAFYRLASCVYFSKHRAAFQPATSAKEVYDNIECDDNELRHLTLIQNIREKMWERVVSEDQMIPNADALKLHWQRCCWVFSYWKQTLKNIMTLSPLTENGWALKNDDISVVWDTDDNLKRVQDTIQWYTKGCSCKSGCTTNRCSCKRQSDRQGRKMGGYCGPGCKCQNCTNIPNVQHQFLESLEEPFELEDNESDLGEEDSDSEDIENTVQDVQDDEYRQYWDIFDNLTA